MSQTPTFASIARNLAGAILPRGTQHPAFCGETSQDIGAGELSWSILEFESVRFVIQKLLDLGAASRSMGQGDSVAGWAGEEITDRLFVGQNGSIFTAYVVELPKKCLWSQKIGASAE